MTMQGQSNSQFNTSSIMQTTCPSDPDAKAQPLHRQAGRDNQDNPHLRTVFDRFPRHAVRVLQCSGGGLVGVLPPVAEEESQGLRRGHVAHHLGLGLETAASLLQLQRRAQKQLLPS